MGIDGTNHWTSAIGGSRLVNLLPNCCRSANRISTRHTANSTTDHCCSANNGNPKLVTCYDMFLNDTFRIQLGRWSSRSFNCAWQLCSSLTFVRITGESPAHKHELWELVAFNGRWCHKAARAMKCHELLPLLGK